MSTSRLSSSESDRLSDSLKSSKGKKRVSRIKFKNSKGIKEEELRHNRSYSDEDTDASQQFPSVNDDVCGIDDISQTFTSVTIRGDSISDSPLSTSIPTFRIPPDTINSIRIQPTIPIESIDHLVDRTLLPASSKALSDSDSDRGEEDDSNLMLQKEQIETNNGEGEFKAPYFPKSHSTKMNSSPPKSAMKLRTSNSDLDKHKSASSDSSDSRTLIDERKRSISRKRRSREQTSSNTSTRPQRSKRSSESSVDENFDSSSRRTTRSMRDVDTNRLEKSNNNASKRKRQPPSILKSPRKLRSSTLSESDESDHGSSTKERKTVKKNQKGKTRRKLDVSSDHEMFVSVKSESEYTDVSNIVSSDPRTRTSVENVIDEPNKNELHDSKFFNEHKCYTVSHPNSRHRSQSVSSCKCDKSSKRSKSRRSSLSDAHGLQEFCTMCELSENTSLDSDGILKLDQVQDTGKKSKNSMTESSLIHQASTSAATKAEDTPLVSQNNTCVSQPVSIANNPNSSSDDSKASNIAMNLLAAGLRKQRTSKMSQQLMAQRSLHSQIETFALGRHKGFYSAKPMKRRLLSSSATAFRRHNSFSQIRARMRLSRTRSLSPNWCSPPSPPLSPLPPSPGRHLITPVISPLPTTPIPESVSPLPETPMPLPVSPLTITPAPEEISPLPESPTTMITSPPMIHGSALEKTKDNAIVAPKPIGPVKAAKALGFNGSEGNMSTSESTSTTFTRPRLTLEGLRQDILMSASRAVKLAELNDPSSTDDDSSYDQSPNTSRPPQSFTAMPPSSLVNLYHFREPSSVITHLRHPQPYHGLGNRDISRHPSSLTVSPSKRKQPSSSSTASPRKSFIVNSTRDKASQKGLQDEASRLEKVRKLDFFLGSDGNSSREIPISPVLNDDNDRITTAFSNITHSNLKAATSEESRISTLDVKPVLQLNLSSSKQFIKSNMVTKNALINTHIISPGIHINSLSSVMSDSIKQPIMSTSCSSSSNIDLATKSPTNDQPANDSTELLPVVSESVTDVQHFQSSSSSTTNTYAPLIATSCNIIRTSSKADSQPCDTKNSSPEAFVSESEKVNNAVENDALSSTLTLHSGSSEISIQDVEDGELSDDSDSVQEPLANVCIETIGDNKTIMKVKTSSINSEVINIATCTKTYSESDFTIPVSSSMAVEVDSCIDDHSSETTVRQRRLKEAQHWFAFRCLSELDRGLIDIETASAQLTLPRNLLSCSPLVQAIIKNLKHTETTLLPLILHKVNVNSTKNPDKPARNKDFKVEVNDVDSDSIFNVPTVADEPLLHY